jgi:hypothetical protein
MRLALLAGLALFFVARAARAQEPAAEEPPIELPPPPPPPPGAETELEPDGPAPEAKPFPAEPGPPAAPTRAPIVETDVALDATKDDRAVDVPRRQAGGDFYGWQIFIGDGSALFLVAVLPAHTELFYGGGVYLVTAPAIHLGHKRGLAALGSFALRLGVPYAAAKLVEGDPSCNDGCIKPSMLVSAIAVSIVDGVWIAREERRAPEPAKHAVSIAPWVSVTRRGATLSMSGAF